MSGKIPAKQVYKFIDKFDTQPEFNEFARSELRLVNREINDIVADHSGIREQKYQIICFWEKKNGRRATLEGLQQLKHDFDARYAQEDEELPEQSRNPSASNYAEPEIGRDSQVQRPLQNTYVPSQRVESGPVNQNPKNLASSRAFIGGNTTTDEQNATPGYTDTNTIMDQMSELSIANESMPCNEVTSVKVEKCTNDDILYIRRNDNIYPVKSNPKGYVLIINNNFTGHDGERIGAGKDVENMKRLWSDLGCRVNVKEDLGAEQIQITLKKVAESPRISDFSFLAIFIMSHGDIREGVEVVLGADCRPVSVKQILAQFSNVQCNGLAGIPKLFFFQFCRGCIIDTGLQYLCQEDKLEDLFKSLRGHFMSDNLDESDFMRRDLVSRSDMLISYATQSGYTAFRNSKGSWFINAIAHIFMKYARSEHVVDLMTRVRSAVSQKTGSTMVSDVKCVPCKEMSETCDLLTRKLFLLPGFPRDDILD